METVDTYIWIEEMLDLYTYWLIEVTKKVKGLTQSCMETE